MTSSKYILGRKRWLVAMLLVAISPPGAGANESERADPDLPSVMQLYREYVANNGGRANIQALNTLIVTGRVEHASGEVNTFKIFQKRPDKTRVKLDFEAYSTDTVTNGREGWREYTNELGKQSVLELDEAAVRSINTGTSIEGPFYTAAQRSDEVKAVGFEVVRGHPTVKVMIAPESDSPYRALWLSEEHFQEVKAERLVPVEADEAGVAKAPVLEEAYYSDFETIEGVYVARRVEYFLDGALDRTVIIEGVRANVGLFDSYFQRPGR